MKHKSQTTVDEDLSTVAEIRDLGARLRRARIKHGLTLDALAQRTQYSKSYLSRIENGRKTPPLATLARVADALGTQLNELLSPTNEQPTGDDPFCEVVRADQRKEVVRGASAFGYDYMSLAETTGARNIQPFLFTFPDEIGPHVFFEHKGEEFLFILSGVVEWQVGHEKYTLKAGDSVYFDARLPHRGRAIEGEAKAVVVLYVPNSAGEAST